MNGGSRAATVRGDARSAPARPTRPTRPTRPPPGLARRLQIAAVVASVLVLALTGTAWGLYRGVTAGITTTDVITGGAADGPQNILLVGVDSRTDAQGNPLPREVLDALHGGPDTGVLNSDTIIVLHVPAGGGAAVAFSIPRDAYVDIPGHRRDKINAAYPVTTALAAEQLVAEGVDDRAEIEAESARQGRQALIGAVEGLTGLRIDHYAEVNLLGFATLTEAIGGVEVCLRRAARDELSGADLPAGPQTISGPDALAFVRQRHGLPDGDLSRIRRQQVFLAAVSRKIAANGAGGLPGLVDTAQRSLVIDSGWDLLDFARQASAIAAGHLEFLTVPTAGLQSNSRGDVVLVDRFQVREFVRQHVQEAAAPPAPGPVALPDDVIASRYLVDVRNGSAAAGLAGTVAAHLGGLGFVRGIVDNTAATAESVVGYTGADRGAAQAVADQLGGIAVERVDDLTPGRLRVVLGADFDPSVVPGLKPAAPASGPITAAGVPCVD